MATTLYKKLAVFSKFNGRCAYCGCKVTIEDFHVDHIVSKNSIKSGKAVLPEGVYVNDISNLNPSCSSCNGMKYDFSLEDFRSFLKNGLRRMVAHEAKLKIALKLGVVSFRDRDIVFYFEKQKRTT